MHVLFVPLYKQGVETGHKCLTPARAEMAPSSKRPPRLPPLAAALGYYAALPLAFAALWGCLLPFLAACNCLGALRRLARKGERYPHRLSRDVMLRVEQDMLQRAVRSARFKHVDAHVDAHIDGRGAELHYLEVACGPGASHGTAAHGALVLIHGTGGSSASWFPVLDGLAEHFATVYALDLPGFGRAEGGPPRCGAAPPAPDATVGFYTRFIRAFFEHAGVRRATVVAHSFGAYLAVKFAAAHPELVDRLVLVSPAGTFATQAGWGAWLATLFKCSFPQCVARGLGGFGVRGWYAYFDCARARGGGRGDEDEDLENTYFKAQLWARSTADVAVGAFIGRTFAHSYWTRPMLRDVLGLPTPLALVYGEADAIIPYHNGVALSEIAGGDVPCYVVPGGGHAPFKGGDRPRLFCRLVLDAIAAARPFGAAAKAMALRLTDEHMCRFKTSFSFARATEDLAAQYAHFKQLAAPAAAARAT
jgi:pimeloyl-ACP methyl ester carboxylesterase